MTADRVYGNGGETGDITAVGRVDMKYADADIFADQAVYSGTTKIVHATGHVRYVAATGDVATAQTLDYDTAADRISMTGVEGQSPSVALQGQPIHGYLFYGGEHVTVTRDGHTVLERGWVTTCDPRRPAYHVTGRNIEIRPGDRVIARGSALYLGKLLVGALGLLVLPLTESAARRPSAFAPRAGYNSTYGYFIRNYVNFYRDQYLYGTYHVDFYQKVGVGLGADVYFARRDGLGSGQFSIYNLRNNARQQQLSGAKNNLQASLSLQRVLGHHVTGSLQFNYTGSTGVLSSIPPTTSANLNLTHTGLRSTTTYSATINSTGPSSAVGGFFNHSINFTPTFGENVQLGLQSNTTPGAFSRSITFVSDTRLSARAFDVDLVTSTNHGLQITTDPTTGAQVSNPVIGFQKVPELTLRARQLQIPPLRLPVLMTMVDGLYNDEYDRIETARYEVSAQFGPAFYRVGQSSEVTASATLRQDAYGTGDLRGSIGEQVSLRTFLGRHADNTLSYGDQSVRGFTPLRSYDLITGFDQINETLNVYNGGIYRFTASTNYDFRNKFLSAITYQLVAQPGPQTSLSLGTSYDPHGSGYSPLVISLATPLGPADYLQFQGNYDFKLHGLQGQNYYLTHTVGNCYQIRVAYLQPLKEVTFGISLLAFPGQGVNFGINSNGPIVPQSFEL